MLAHAMSVVAVQSGVGAHVIDSRPDQAKRILETISETSRESMKEMRSLLDVLRDNPEVQSPTSWRRRRAWSSSTSWSTG